MKKTSSQIQRLERKINTIKDKLMVLDTFRIGSLSEQSKVCGNPNCRCRKAPEHKHGPYYLLSWTRKGKSSTRFVRQQELKEIKKQMKNFDKFKQLTDQWIDLSTKLANLELLCKEDV